MIPFLKNKQDAASSTSIDKVERKPDSEEYDVLESAAEDLCHAIEAKDYKAIAAALRAAFDLLDSQPHEEDING